MKGLFQCPPQGRDRWGKYSTVGRFIIVLFIRCLRKQPGKGCVTCANVCMKKCRIFVFFFLHRIGILLKFAAEKETR